MYARLMHGFDDTVLCMCVCDSLFFTFTSAIDCNLKFDAKKTFEKWLESKIKFIRVGLVGMPVAFFGVPSSSSSSSFAVKWFL